MKGRIFIVVLLVAAAAVAGRWVNGDVSVSVSGGSQREETRQSFRLDPGARVEVRKINGKVEVKTADTDMAEVHILRTGSGAADLKYGRVTVEGSSSYLVVRGEEGRGGGLWRRLRGGGRIRHEVTLVLPRRVELSASHVNGALLVGEVEGPVEVAHVNGRVEVAQSADRSQISHVNGRLRVGVSRLGADGLEVAHVNGNVEIGLSQAVDADVEVQGHNGGLTLDVPNVTQHERLNRSYTRLRFGAGGTPIQISRVNGNVRFEAGGAPAPAVRAAEVSVSATAAVPPLPPLPPAPPAP